MYIFWAVIGLVAGFCQGATDPNIGVIQGAISGFFLAPFGWFFVKRICIESIRSIFR